MTSNYGVAPATQVLPSHKDANQKYSNLWHMRHHQRCSTRKNHQKSRPFRGTSQRTSTATPAKAKPTEG